MTIHFKHDSCSTYDITILDYLLVDKRMYSIPLRLPNLPSTDPYATKYTGPAIALQQDPEFKQDFDNAINHQIFLLQNELFKKKKLQLDKAIAELTNDSQIKFIAEYTYHEVIYKTMDKYINAIKKDTKR